MSTSAISEKHRCEDLCDLHVPDTLMLGPGPSNVPPRVLAAMSINTIGHLHAPFVGAMDDVQTLLRYVMQTDNQLTLGVTGSGAACMEACIVNLLQPGQTLLVVCNGYWGNRCTDVARRQGVLVEQVVGEWGTAVDPALIAERVREVRPSALFVTHGESSTGVCQPLTGLGEACREVGALLIVDAVVTLGGVPLMMDEWKIDAMYSGAQKCLSSPPGLSPLSFGERAMEVLRTRDTKVASFYLDMLEVGKYWGSERKYHHTGSINNVYALREGLRVVHEEGLQAAWDRHASLAETLYDGLEKLGLELLVKKPEDRLAPLTTVRIPEGVDGKAVQAYMMNTFHIEIAGGLGDLAGKIWRIGLMGHNCQPRNVKLVLTALEEALEVHGFFHRNHE